MRKLRFSFSGFIALFLTQIFFGAQNSSSLQQKKDILKVIEQKSQLIIDASDNIWDYAEIAMMEYESSKVLEDILEQEGFQVEKDIADLPTAFVAIFGSGEPIIGILAEYDALPGLSQDSTPFKKELSAGGAGHGCGHNLFGPGSIGAAIGLKEVMERYNLKGTLKLYGCPAEEDVGGKLYMARAGLFDDLDACIAWHPSFETKVDLESTLAIDDLKVEFFGKTAHAAFDPWRGNSALDAVEMMTFGINLLREHIKPSVRIHYVITKGGDVPNVVPGHAEAWVWVRDMDRTGVKAVVQKIEKIVEGSSLATGTTSKMHYLGSYYEMLVNRKGSDVM